MNPTLHRVYGIHKLLEVEYPFFNVQDRNSTRINDQNSKGCIVGYIGTMFPGTHAFLAIPEESNDKDPR